MRQKLKELLKLLVLKNKVLFINYSLVRHDRKCYGSVDGQALELLAESPGDMRQLTNLASLYIG